MPLREGCVSLKTDASVCLVCFAINDAAQGDDAQRSTPREHFTPEEPSRHGAVQSLPSRKSRASNCAENIWNWYKAFLVVVVIVYPIVTLKLFGGLGLPELTELEKPLLRRDRLLAVVVPVHNGDVARAMIALSRWPTTCHHNTLGGADLVIYKAEALSDELPQVPYQASKCFRKTKVIGGNLLPEENVYPTGASVMFYKMYLDDRVASSLQEYEALAILEWDVVVAHPTSFSRLYGSAFFFPEPFWVKGSTLAGSEFHQTAFLSDKWHTLGHLNGNALYNNNDPAFIQFVNFTLIRWGYDYSYDVALWATLSDFPYSWPIWQRYSHYFVATKLIQNIGFVDINDRGVAQAISQDTLFIHGSSQSGGSVAEHMTNGALETHHGNRNCTDLCGSVHVSGLPPGTSTYCDETCTLGWSSAGPRFGGHNCGAGDAPRFGSTCRLCYTNENEALAADRTLASSSVDPTAQDAHVVMCNTGEPPSDSSCSASCQNAADTVCDFRCGSGRYGDLNCNWRNLGKTCRRCFHESLAAHHADEVAKINGGRIILCNTHEPPILIASHVKAVKESLKRDSAVPDDEDSSAISASADEATDGDPSAKVFVGNTTRGQMCTFLLGYFEFLEETIVSVSSVQEFMPGMRVAIATQSQDFHLFNRTFGHLSGVSVAASSCVEYAALMADKLCGSGTRLIYYMELGGVLSRTFTTKDTHTVQGDLIVSFTDPDNVHVERIRRAMGSSLLLGFSVPVFSHGNDLILPAETNSQLRAVLSANRTILDKANAEDAGAVRHLGTGCAYLKSLANMHGHSTTFYIPEVLAGLAYSKRPPGVTFSDPHGWTRQNLFSVTSIWDIPLVKPPFTCVFDLSLNLKGYITGKSIVREFEAFKHGAKCELGFMRLEKSELSVNIHREFGASGAAQKRMPDLQDFNVSILYLPSSGDAHLFNLSIATVIEHVPGALEVVVVVLEADEALFEGIIDPFRASAPFSIRIVAEPELMNGHVQQKYSKLRGDLYTGGDFILHLDSNMVIYEDVTYAHIFHLGKPVLPFRRYRMGNGNGSPGRAVAMCWQNGTSSAIAKHVVHEFNVFKTHTYPRSMYAAAREFIEQHHRMSFFEFMSTRRGMCAPLDTMAKWTNEESNTMFSAFNFMGAYLWYHMHKAVYWLATDPYDLQPGDWRTDLLNFLWFCQANRLHAPSDAAGLEQFFTDYRMVKTHSQCVAVNAHWGKAETRNPATRTAIDLDRDIE